MWRFLTNMSIAHRLMVAALMTALIPGIVISILGSSYLDTLHSINETVKSGDDAVKLATTMQADLLRMNALLGALSTATDSTADNTQNQLEITKLTHDFASILATYQQDYQIATSTKMKSIRDALQDDQQGNQAPTSQHSILYVVDLQWRLYDNAQGQVLQDVQQAGADTLAGDIAQANLEYLPLKGNLDNLVALSESISQIVAQINASKVDPTLFWTVVAFFLSTLMVFITSYVINLTITRPLRQIVRLTERIAQGETSARAVAIGHDETYMVAISMNTMLDSIVTLMKNIQRQHDYLEARVQALIGEMKGPGSGDLRSRAEVTTDALGFLAHAFNYMIDEVSSLVARVKTTTNEVGAQTRVMQASLAQLVNVSGRQLQDMAAVVRAVDHMADETSTIADLSQALVKITQETQQAACLGREEVERAGLGMTLHAVFDGLKRQAEAIESINAKLNRQALLSQSVLHKVQDAEERQKKNCVHTGEAAYTMGNLAHLVGFLRLSIDVFKLREEEFPLASS